MSIERLNDLASRIMVAQRERRHAKNSQPYAPRSTTATSLGYRCDRRLVYARTMPHYAEGIDPELASIFEEGNLHQEQIRRELSELGFEALEAERTFRDEDLEIGGRIDGMLPLSGEHRAERVPVEIKSTAGDPPSDSDGLRYHGGLYTRYFAQMQIYLYLTGTPYGMFLFKNKVTGLWTCVVVELDYDYTEGLLRKAERVRDHIRADTLPNQIEDRSECKWCPFKDSICHPEDAAADPLLLVDDKDLLGKLVRREHLAARAREYKRIDEEIKERFRLTKGDRFIVGDESGFIVRKKSGGSGMRLDIRRLSEL